MQNAIGWWMSGSPAKSVTVKSSGTVIAAAAFSGVRPALRAGPCWACVARGLTARRASASRKRTVAPPWLCEDSVGGGSGERGPTRSRPACDMQAILGLLLLLEQLHDVCLRQRLAVEADL